MVTTEPRQDPMYWQRRLERSLALLDAVQRVRRQRPVAEGTMEQLLLIAETARGHLWRLGVWS